MKRGLFSILVISMSLSAAFAEELDSGNICESKDPLLSAAEVECFPENNKMVIHKPKYLHLDKELNVAGDVLKICQAFGSDNFIGLPKSEQTAPEVKVVKKGLFSKKETIGRDDTIVYNGKDLIQFIEKNTQFNTVESITCALVDTRPRAQVGDDNHISCYEVNDDGSRGKKLPDNRCHYGYAFRTDINGAKSCFHLDQKKVAYGQSVNKDFCDGTINGYAQILDGRYDKSNSRTDLY